MDNIGISFLPFVILAVAKEFNLEDDRFARQQTVIFELWKSIPPLTASTGYRAGQHLYAIQIINRLRLFQRITRIEPELLHFQNPRYIALKRYDRV